MQNNFEIPRRAERTVVLRQDSSEVISGHDRQATKWVRYG